MFKCYSVSQGHDHEDCLKEVKDQYTYCLPCQERYYGSKTSINNLQERLKEKSMNAPATIIDYRPREERSFASKCALMPLESLLELEPKFDSWLKTNKSHPDFPKFLKNYKIVNKYINIKSG
jgi:hypothetical protein